MMDEFEVEKNKTPEKRKFSVYFYNIVTYVGVVLSVFIFIVECCLFVFESFTHDANVYIGIITYCMLPPFLIVGLLLIPIGALWKRRRVRLGKKSIEPRRFFIDPAKSTHRNAIFIFLVGTSILIIMTGIGSYKAFHYTESVHFCGTVCHKVMEPEYAVYSQSAHARILCVNCHIGSGADWYVRSKLSGLRQVFKTIANDYPRPIPTPVHNLRPAKETCEQCHWPEKFYSSFELRQTYYPTGNDEYSSWNIRMLLKVGQGGKGDYGIHEHMNIDNDIYYAAEDERRQVISWVKKVGKDGKETVYMSPNSSFKEEDPLPEDIRMMDCMDCHNRPSHNFGAPYELVNKAIWDERIDVNIPSIKLKALEALSGEYASSDEAEETIVSMLTSYYREKHHNYYIENKQVVEDAIKQINLIYRKNFFPEMKVRWDVHPDNIGHLTSPGCFRCHDGEHKTSDGEVISRECSSCHTIIEQGPPGEVEKNLDGMPFRHPFEEHEMWKEMSCFECHTGGAD